MTARRMAKKCGHCDLPLESTRAKFHPECKAERNIPRRCSRCKKVKPSARFSNDRSRADGKFPWCMTCQNAHGRSSAWQDPEAAPNGHICKMCGVEVRGHRNRRFCSSKCKDRVSKLRQKYGLTPDDYNRLVALNSDGRCPICLKRATIWNVDHDHKTGLTTGVVCVRCNRGLLAFSDHKVDQAKRLYEYLLNPPAQQIGIVAVAEGPPPESKVHTIWQYANEKKKAEESKP